MNPMERLMEDAAHVVEFKSVTVCQECGQRRPLFCIHGTVKADRTPTLCFQCYRALVNRTRAGWAVPLPIRLAASAVPAPARVRGEREAFYAQVDLRRRRALQVARHAMEGLTTTVPASPVPIVLERVS